MESEIIEVNEIMIKLSKRELLILNNALNEVCNALDLFEFQTRMGAELEEVQELLDQIKQVIDLIEEQA